MRWFKRLFRREPKKLELWQLPWRSEAGIKMLARHMRELSTYR